METRIVLLALIICIPFLGYSQFDQDEDFQTEQDSINIDSIDYASYAKKTNSFKVLFSGKPGRAALYSLIIPGGGQMYNKKYWKAPIVWAVDGVTGYLVYSNYTLYRGYKQGYQDLYDNKISSYDGFTSAQAVREYRDFYQKNYETTAILGVAVHLLTVIEAYVDRHLMDFDISEDLSLNLSPMQVPFATPSLGFGIQVALH